MIFDHFQNSRLYGGLSLALRHGLEFLTSTRLAELPIGRTEIDRDNVFALVQEYDTKPVAQCRWESHREYCDIQCLASGAERIGVSQLDRVRTIEDYSAPRDVAFYDGDGDFLTMRPGWFLILWPHDIHMPCVAIDTPLLVRKIVVKARMS